MGDNNGVLNESRLDYGLGGSSNYIRPISWGHKCRCQNTESREPTGMEKTQNPVDSSKRMGCTGQDQAEELEEEGDIRGLSYDEMDLLMSDQVKTFVIRKRLMNGER